MDCRPMSWNIADRRQMWGRIAGAGIADTTPNSGNHDGINSRECLKPNTRPGTESFLPAYRYFLSLLLSTQIQSLCVSL